MGGQKSQHPGCHFAASGMAACINFPLWKASAIGQSGFTAGSTRGRGVIGRYLDAMKPPYKGVSATILGMTWARAFIFYGSDMGKAYLESIGVQNPAVTVMVPPLVTSTMVQLVNMPVIRASVTIQNPASEYTNVREALRAIHSSKGLAGLWHGTSAGIMKTVPKASPSQLAVILSCSSHGIKLSLLFSHAGYSSQYCVAVGVKHGMEKWLPKNDNELARSAAKSVAAGVSGAVLTNPLDVLRNEMFKTDRGVRYTLGHLMKTEGYWFTTRGMTKNLIAVAIPIAITIFLTDCMVKVVEGRQNEGELQCNPRQRRQREYAGEGRSMQYRA